jgi:hypothetical protein
MATCTIEYRCGCKAHFDRSDKWLHQHVNGVCPVHRVKILTMTFDPFQAIEELVPKTKRSPGILPGDNG